MTYIHTYIMYVCVFRCPFKVQNPDLGSVPPSRQFLLSFECAGWMPSSKMIEVELVSPHFPNDDLTDMRFKLV